MVPRPVAGGRERRIQSLWEKAQRKSSLPGGGSAGEEMVGYFLLWEKRVHENAHPKDLQALKACRRDCQVRGPVRGRAVLRSEGGIPGALTHPHSAVTEKSPSLCSQAIVSSWIMLRDTSSATNPITSTGTDSRSSRPRTRFRTAVSLVLMRVWLSRL